MADSMSTEEVVAAYEALSDKEKERISNALRRPVGAAAPVSAAPTAAAIKVKIDALDEGHLRRVAEMVERQTTRQARIAQRPQRNIE